MLLRRTEAEGGGRRYDRSRHTLVLHTRHDELVQVRHAELLSAAAPEPKTLHIFDQGGHDDIFYRNRQAYMQLVETFLATLRRGR